MILFALFFISCRVRRLSMTQSFSCLLLSAESANNRLSSVQFGEKEEHYLSKIKKLSWPKITKKKVPSLTPAYTVAPLPHLFPLLYLHSFFPHTYPDLPTLLSPLCNSTRKRKSILTKKKNRLPPWIWWLSAGLTINVEDRRGCFSMSPALQGASTDIYSAVAVDGLSLLGITFQHCRVGSVSFFTRTDALRHPLWTWSNKKGAQHAWKVLPYMPCCCWR